MLTPSAIAAIAAESPLPLDWSPAERERAVRGVLAAAAEYGGVAVPDAALALNPARTTKAFPGEPAALTTSGLVAFYERRGWEYVVFRVGPLVRAFTGRNAALQEVFARYEERCALEGVSTLPAWADGKPVAGGDNDAAALRAAIVAAGS